jgi:thioredoxin reductase
MSHTNDVVDVIVVGGGPAGLSAALILGRACRTVRVFDSGRYRNHAAAHMHGFLTRDGIAPGEFLSLAREQLLAYDTVWVERAEVASARSLGGATGFEVTTADGAAHRSRFLLLATGVVDNVPDVPGLAELYGKSVFHCPYCDGWEVRGAALAVYGCETRAYGLALELTGWSRDVVIVSDGACGIDRPDLDRLARNGIRIREERVRRLEGHHGQLERIVFESGEPLARRALFFTTGQTQASPLARSLGCEFNDKGTVRTGPYESTSVPGLFVAGDASRAVQWVVVAAAEGAEAAFAINQALIKERLK